MRKPPLTYYQPDEAGDVGCGTSAENIKSFDVYRNKDHAIAAHPDCVILELTDDDVQEPRFLD